MFRERTVGWRAVCAAAALAILASATGALAAPIEQNPPSDEAEGPVLDTRVLAPGEHLSADPVVVTADRLDAAGQTTVVASPPLDGADVLIVDDDKAQCPNADFATAQGVELAVQAAAPGGKIRVCPGLYTPFTIDKPLVVQGPRHQGEATQCQTPTIGNPMQEAVVRGARAPALVEVVSSGVTFEGFTVEQNPDGSGIQTSRLGSGYEIRHNVVQGNRNGADLNSDGAFPTQFRFNCVRLNGLALVADPTGGTGVISTEGVANAWIVENYITGHDCSSIGLTGPQSCLALPGPLPAITDVTIAHNDIVDDANIGIATATNVAIDANSILLRRGPAVVVSGFGGPVSDVTVSFNHIDGQENLVTQGIFVTPSGPTLARRVTVRANKVENVSDFPLLARAHGIVIRSTETFVHENWVEDNRGNGIEIRGGARNLIHGNLVVANGTPSGDLTDGIRIRPGSTQNVVENNRLRLNTTHDCHDGNPAGANTWRHNVGDTENQPGLCVRPG